MRTKVGEGERERGRPADWSSAADGRMERSGGWEERHFHQDYPAAENLIWESGPVPSKHTHTHRHTQTHTHTHTHRHTQTLPQEAAKTLLLHLRLPRKAPRFSVLVFVLHCAKWLNCSGSLYIILWICACACVCVCGPSICSPCWISLEFLPLDYTVYSACVPQKPRAHPRRQAAAGKEKAWIAARCFVFRAWRHQGRCRNKLCDGSGLTQRTWTKAELCGCQSDYSASRIIDQTTNLVIDSLFGKNAKHWPVPALQMWGFAASVGFILTWIKHLQGLRCRSDRTSFFQDVPFGSGTAWYLTVAQHFRRRFLSPFDSVQKYANRKYQESGSVSIPW